MSPLYTVDEMKEYFLAVKKLQSITNRGTTYYKIRAYLKVYYPEIYEELQKQQPEEILDYLLGVL